MRKTIIAGVVSAVILCSGLASQKFSVEAKPEHKKSAKVTTAAQAANIARLYYINGGRGVTYKGKPETLTNWKSPLVWRSKSKQNNLLWNVSFSVPDKKVALDFVITITENGKIFFVANVLNNGVGGD